VRNKEQKEKEEEEDRELEILKKHQEEILKSARINADAEVALLDEDSVNKLEANDNEKIEEVLMIEATNT